jgi:enhancer of yellow 2 transcription factor
MTILRGQRPILKDYLIQALHESGWTDKVRLICREEIQKSSGQITVDNLVDKVTPKARQNIPDEIKAELIMKIKQTLLEAENSNED